MTVRIVVPDDHPVYLRGTPAEARLRALGDVTIFDTDPRDAAELVRRCVEAEIVYNTYGRTKFTAEVLAALPKLRLISRPGTGVDGIDLDACRRHGIAVTHLRGNDADEIAEHAIALMLCCLRRIPEMDRRLRGGDWSADYIRGARGATLGIVGLGAIGRRTAMLGKALGMKVLAWSFGADGGRAAGAGAERIAELDDLLRQADVVSLHLRVSPDTRGMFDATRLGLMKPGAVLVNTARGALVDRDALLAALREGRLCAGLDVFHTEPLPKDDPLLTLPNVVMTPHDGSVMPDVVARGVMTAVVNIENWLKGAPTNLAVDPRPGPRP